jgi:hypothetical protein
MPGGAARDKVRPNDARIGDEQAAHVIERMKRRMPPQIDQPRVGSELLPAHRVTAAAERELRTGGACGADVR